MEQPEPTSFVTHLMLPGWWVRAYEAASLAEASGAGAMAQACAAGLAPAMSALELNALAMVLASLQTQVLAGGPGAELTISSEEHLKHAGTAVRGRRFAFEKVIQVLTGVRLLREGADGSLRSQSPFAGDRWTLAGGGGEVRVALSLAPLGRELLLGLSDAHQDLVRFAAGDDEGAAALGAAAPLSLRRSIWLEVQGVEQLLLLRIARAMQWEFRWLQLEGIFGLPLAELFAGVRLPETDGASELARRVRLLLRLGRRLAAHGFLTQAVADQYLAVDDAGAGEADWGRGGEAPTRKTSPSDAAGAGSGGGRGLTLVWQATPSQLAADVEAGYRLAAQADVRRRFAGESLDGLVRIAMSSAAGADVFAEARAAWARLAVVTPPVRLNALDARPSQPVLPQALFLEHCLRRLPGARHALPETLEHGPLTPAISGGLGGDLEERFLRYCRLVDDDTEFPRSLRESPLLSLVSPATRADRAFRAEIQGLLADEAHRPRLVTPVPQPGAEQGGGAAARGGAGGGAAPGAGSPFGGAGGAGSPFGGAAAGAGGLYAGAAAAGRGAPGGAGAGGLYAGAAAARGGVGSPGAGGPGGAGLVPPAVAAAAGAEEPRRQGAVSGALASRMLKIASDELQRLRTSDLPGYQELRRLYYESLEPPARQALADVQKRIQPHLFEDQLRRRLVRFMVDNPGSWRSAEGR